MTAPDYGRAFALWRDAAGSDWHDYTDHAFVRGLADGTLPRANFLHYLKQDYVFLIHFSRAWALAAAKSERLSEMRAASATVHGLLHVEMPLHVGICADAGISERDLETTPESPANMAYTRFVLASGYSGDFLDLLAALAPCVLGYGEIGARHRDAGGPYADWTATYGGDDYQSLCRDVGALIDDALTYRLGDGWADLPRMEQLAQTFAKATRLEVGFWQMGMDRT
ncbi:thiaminase II [Paracoccus sp. (in: a-proteobacteria)]|uniref:thiaminase II n=1 Tax=Paracoccus sp. TaxID=267 RepID=UPI0026E004D6|nr:thiaminase II [Paracoccus sp. (in: a-proteobacteria)]MDO5647109.1 thiaminase II [Paracoccus sp. (in: a-proteobacteria)]